MHSPVRPATPADVPDILRLVRALALYEREPDDVVGFVIGQLVPAPPIFDPGGKTLLVDDGRWPMAAAGEALFAALRTWAVKQGATQLVGVTAVGDEDRRATFDALGLHPTTQWWTKEL